MLCGMSDVENSGAAKARVAVHVEVKNGRVCAACSCNERFKVTIPGRGTCPGCGAEVATGGDPKAPKVWVDGVRADMLQMKAAQPVGA